ncbi:MAG: DciA family protein [Proteobacteria bacterium]|nr:DciA family protein [Pseudomonadota bacterium]
MTKSPKIKSWGKGPRALAAVLPKVAEPALRKRGFSAVEIITNWREIVGPDLADEASPDRLAFPRGARSQGTLHVTAPGAVALEIQHLEPLIIERINTYFGYGAVCRIALTQGPARKRPDAKSQTPARPRKVNPIRQAEIDASTNGIASEPLRDALRNLGKSVASAQDTRHEST